MRRPLVPYAAKIKKDAARMEFVLSHFPDSDYDSYQYSDKFLFSSKQVNKNYTDFDFIYDYRVLYIAPYYKLNFNYENVEETIKVFSQPLKNKLAYLTWGKDKVIKFARIKFNFKKNELSNELIQQCQPEIMNFIQKNEGAKIDSTHLDPRLKSLLSFL
jgi:hypothetical protein